MLRPFRITAFCYGVHTSHTFFYFLMGSGSPFLGCFLLGLWHNKVGSLGPPGGAFWILRTWNWVWGFQHRPRKTRNTLPIPLSTTCKFPAPALATPNFPKKKSKVYLLRAQEEWTKDIQPFPRGTGGLLLANCSRNAAQPSKCLQPGPALSLVFQKSVIAVNYFTRQINLWMKYYPPPFPMKTF